MTTYNYELQYIMNKLPMLDGFVLWSWAYANDPVHKFGGIKMKNGGYLGDERDLLLDELKVMYHNAKK